MLKLNIHIILFLEDELETPSMKSLINADLFFSEKNVLA